MGFSFYAATNKNRIHYLLDSNHLNLNILNSLEDNCKSYFTRDGHKISILKNSDLPSDISQILSSSSERNYNDIISELKTLTAINDLPQFNVDQVNLAVRNRFATKRDVKEHQIKPGLVSKKENDDSPLKAILRGDLKKITEYANLGELTAISYLERSDRLDLNVLKFYFEKNPELIKESVGIPYYLHQDQRDIYLWARSVGIEPATDKLYGSLKEPGNRVHILQFAYDYNEPLDLAMIGSIALKRRDGGLDIIRWLEDKLENENQLTLLKIQAAEINNQAALDILNNFKTQKLI